MIILGNVSDLGLLRTYIVDEVTDSFAYVVNTEYFCRVLGQKQYELSNHLGNVLATVLDRKTGVYDPTEDTLMHYEADVVTATLYYPFGMAMMSYKNEEFSYAYGQNGQEKEDEIFEGAYSAEYWIYDSRLGRRYNRDIVEKPYESVYACFANNPIWFVDYNGADSTVYIYSTALKKDNGEVIHETLTEAELVMIKDEMQRINEQNGIFLKYKIVTPEEFNALNLSETDFELNLTFQWDIKEIGTYGTTGGIKGLYSDVYMNRVEGLCANNGIEKGSNDYNYVAAFIVTHELMHQMIIRSENLFRVKTTDSKGHNKSSILNLNTEGTTVLGKTEKGDLVNILKKSSILITNQHSLIQNYFRYIELENELNKFLFYDNLNDREKLKKEMRSIYHNPTGQGKL